MGSQRVGHDLATEHARNDVEHIFHVLICHLYDLFGEMSLLLIFSLNCLVFLLLNLPSSLYILDTSPCPHICKYVVYKYFLPVCSLSFHPLKTVSQSEI